MARTKQEPRKFTGEKCPRNTTAVIKVPQKPRRLRPGTVAVREIRKFQKSTDRIIPRAPFTRLVKELAQGVSKTDYRWQDSSIEALQEATEAFLATFFEDVRLCAQHAQRVTIDRRDIALVKRFHGLK